MKFGELTVPMMIFADDTTLCSEKGTVVGHMLDSYKNTAVQYGLKVNEEKCEYMTSICDEKNERQGESKNNQSG